MLIGPETSDDAGVYLLDRHALVATVDFIPPVCDEARRYGRVAAANALSDVWAMGGRPLFALNVCCFPEKVPVEARADILAGGAEALAEAGAALLGGHSVSDPELKFGLAVVGEVDRDRLLANDRARPGDRLLLTKPLGTGVMINAFKFDKLDAAGLEPALVEMERLNRTAARLAVEHGARAATDVTGFGLVGHALNVARGSRLSLSIRYDALPVHDAFHRLAKAGVSTGCTEANREAAAPFYRERRPLGASERELLFDPQTSGGLLLCVPAEAAGALLDALLAAGHRAAEIGEATAGEPGVAIV